MKIGRDEFFFVRCDGSELPGPISATATAGDVIIAISDTESKSHAIATVDAVTRAKITSADLRPCLQKFSKYRDGKALQVRIVAARPPRYETPDTTPIIDALLQCGIGREDIKETRVPSGTSFGAMLDYRNGELITYSKQQKVRVEPLRHDLQKMKIFTSNRRAEGERLIMKTFGGYAENNLIRREHATNLDEIMSRILTPNLSAEDERRGPKIFRSGAESSLIRREHVTNLNEILSPEEVAMHRSGARHSDELLWNLAEPGQILAFVHWSDKAAAVIIGVPHKDNADVNGVESLLTRLDSIYGSRDAPLPSFDLIVNAANQDVLKLETALKARLDEWGADYQVHHIPDTVRDDAVGGTLQIATSELACFSHSIDKIPSLHIAAAPRQQRPDGLWQQVKFTTSLTIASTVSTVVLVGGSWLMMGAGRLLGEALRFDWSEFWSDIWSGDEHGNAHGRLGGPN